MTHLRATLAGLLLILLLLISAVVYAQTKTQARLTCAAISAGRADAVSTTVAACLTAIDAIPDPVPTPGPGPGPTPGPAGNRLGQQDLVYTCTFKLPPGPKGVDSLEYANGQLAFYQDPTAGATLYMKGQLSRGYASTTSTVIQVAIPQNCLDMRTTPVANLTTATVVRNFVSMGSIPSSAIMANDPNGGHGSLLAYGGKLLGAECIDYDSTNKQTTYSAWGATLAMGGTTGPYKFSQPGAGPRAFCDYLIPIPAPWQAPLGGTILGGAANLSIVSAGVSEGPQLVAIDGDAWAKAPAANSTIASTALAFWKDDNCSGCAGNHPRLGRWNSNARTQVVDMLPVPTTTFTNPNAPGGVVVIPYEDGSVRTRGGIFPDATRSVLIFGNKGLGTYCYGDGTACNDPQNPYQGDHAYPYTFFVWAFDAADLAAVKAGTKQPYEVAPYAGWPLDPPGYDGQFPGPGAAGGAAFNPTGRLAYVSIRVGDPNSTPLVHVYKVAVP